MAPGLDASMAARIAALRAAREQAAPGESLSPEMDALVGDIGLGAEDVAGRARFRRGPVEGTIAVGEPGGPAESEDSDPGPRAFAGERIESDPGEMAMGLASQASERKRPAKVDAVAEALRFSAAEAQRRRGQAIDQARHDSAGASIGSDAYYSHLMKTPDTSAARKEAARARLSQLMQQDALAVGSDGDQMAGRLDSNEKAARTEAAAIEMVKRERAKEEAQRSFTTSEREAGQTFRAGEADKERATELERERMRRRQAVDPNKADAKAEAKAAQTDAELRVPGYDRKPGAPAIKREEAAGFRVSVASGRELSDSSKQLRALIEDKGSELVGPVKARMANISRDMLLKMKDLAKLGVLSKSDEDILNDLIPNPTGISGALTSTDSMLANLDAFDDSVRRKLDSQAYSLGYDKKPGDGSSSAPGWSDADEKRLQELEARARK